MSEWYKRMNERTSKWLCTRRVVSIVILPNVCSGGTEREADTAKEANEFPNGSHPAINGPRRNSGTSAIPEITPIFRLILFLFHPKSPSFSFLSEVL